MSVPMTPSTVAVLGRTSRLTLARIPVASSMTSVGNGPASSMTAAVDADWLLSSHASGGLDRLPHALRSTHAASPTRGTCGGERRCRRERASSAQGPK